MAYDLPVKRTYGGDAQDSEGNYLITQSQHLTANKDFYFASQLIKHSVVEICYNTGKHSRNIGSGGFSDGEFDVPGGVALWQGKLLVTDVNEGNIQLFALDGTFEKRIGAKGSGPLEFMKPNGLAVDENNNVYVAELGNKRIQVLDSQLRHKEDLKCSLYGMSYVTYDSHHKRLIVSDSDANKIVVLGLDGKEITRIADVGSSPGQITYPCGTAVDKNGNILVSDYVNNRVQVFDKDAKYISALGADNVIMQWPIDVCVVGDEISVMDGNAFQGWNRIQVF